MVPDDTTGAIRCVQYFVLDAFSGVNGSIYHSSTYGALTDKQWDEMRQQIIKDFGKLEEESKDTITKAVNEINSI